MSRLEPVPDFDRGADAYRRRIRIETVASGAVVCELEDDFHDFVVTLHHDAGRVGDVTCESRRWPWSTCPDAAHALHALVDMPLSRRFTAAGRWTDPKANCTHQFDAACHAITHAAWGRERRVYDMEVPRRDPEVGTTRARLWCDGEPALEWSLTWEGITDPDPPYDGAPWRGGFMRWADATLPEAEAECAIALRRVADIGLGRAMDLDAVPVASQLPASMSGICHTMQPGIVEVAIRNKGTIRDFADAPERLCAQPL
jgi:hypothetical protein